MQNLQIYGGDGFEQFRNFLLEKGITGEIKKLYDSDFSELIRENVKINLFLRLRKYVCQVKSLQHNTNSPNGSIALENPMTILSTTLSRTSF